MPISPPLCKVCGVAHWMREGHQFPKSSKVAGDRSPAEEPKTVKAGGAPLPAVPPAETLAKAEADAAHLAPKPKSNRGRKKTGFDKAAYDREYRAKKRAEAGQKPRAKKAKKKPAKKAQPKATA